MTTTNEGQSAAARDRIETKKRGKRIDGVARRHCAVEHITINKAVNFRTLEYKPWRLDGVGKRRDQMIKRRAFKSAVEPVTRRPIVAVAPYGAQRRKSGIGARVPAPDMNACRIDHASAINRRHRIDGGGVRARGVEMQQRRFKKARLYKIVAKGAGKPGASAFRRPCIGKNIRRIGAAINGRATGFDNPYGFGFCDPRRWLREFDAIRTFNMRVRPMF